MKSKIITTIILFVLAFAATSLTMTQVITMDRYLLNILFLSVVSLGLIIYFKHTFIDIISKINWSTFILLFAFSLIIHVATSYFIINFLKQPIWPFSSAGASFLLMNNFYLWTKPFDVFLQQLLIILLVTKLHQYKLNLRQITVVFVFGFGLVHIFQIFKTNLVVGLGFTGVAILLSALYPYMILKVKNGCLFNYMIHLGVYNLAAILAWSLY